MLNSPEPPPLVVVQLTTFSCVTYWRSVLRNVSPVDAEVTVADERSLFAWVTWNELCSRMFVAKVGSVEWTLPPAYGTGSVAVAQRLVFVVGSWWYPFV